MHNLEVLVRGRERCALLVHPNDGRAAGLKDGGRARHLGGGKHLLNLPLR